MIKSQHKHKVKQLEESQMELMTANLMKIHRQITQQAQQQTLDHVHASPYLHSSPQSSIYKAYQPLSQIRQNQSYQHNLRLPSPLSSRSKTHILLHQYQSYLHSNPLPSNHQSKIQLLLSHPLSIGNAVALFQMLYYFRQALSYQILQEIKEKAFRGMVESQRVEEKRCYGQLLAGCGVQDQEICQYCAQGLLDNSIQLQLAVLILVNQGDTGMHYLLDLSQRQISSLSNHILDYLCQTNYIISNLIIPQLIQDTSHQQPKARDIALAALSRLAPLISPRQVQRLVQLIDDPSVDKKLLLSVIRCCGGRGEQLILEMIESREYSQLIQCLALSVLSWRVPNKASLRLKTIEYTLENCLMPGRLYQYQGDITPWNYSNQNCPDTLCLNARQFVTQLDLLIKRGMASNSGYRNCSQLFQLMDLLELQENQRVQISQEVVRVLAWSLKHKSVKVRQIALVQLGNIGAPEAALAIQSITKCLQDSDSAIRSAACWTISRTISTSNSNISLKKIQSKICSLLKDPFWKVRTSACIALGTMITQPHLNTIQSMVKSLQDGSIPKGTICQSLAKMGAQQLLLQILKGSTRNDFKLKEAVVSSFEWVRADSDFMNVIVEELIRSANDSRKQMRQLSLMTLNSLKRRVGEERGQTISCFQTKNLLPFYYCFLEDSSSKIRTLAAQNILSYGSQAELIFIQGVTKGQPLTRIQCIKSLGKLGVQNFRAVVLGLRDQDLRVRKAASESILLNFSVQDIVSEFMGKQKVSISLLCNLREMMSSIGGQLREMLGMVIKGLQGKSNVRRGDQNARIN